MILSSSSQTHTISYFGFNAQVDIPYHDLNMAAGGHFEAVVGIAIFLSQY